MLEDTIMLGVVIKTDEIGININRINSFKPHVIIFYFKLYA
jgi:hypothetical protein